MATREATAAPPSFPDIEPGASLILAFQIAKKKVLLVGGGVVAAGRLQALLAADAIVTLVSPSNRLSPEIELRLKQGLISEYFDRNFIDSDLEGMEMVLTAIDEDGLSSRICTMCREKRIPVNVADVPPECDFYFGSIVRRGPLQIMVSTGGNGPRIANRIRKAIEEALPIQVGEGIASVGRLRQALRVRAAGRGKELIDRRMGWMIRVCDKWSIDELACMTDEMRERVLDGWEEGVTLDYYQTKGGVLGYLASKVGWGKCPVIESPDGRASRCPFILSTSGFVIGMGTMGIVAAVWSRYSR